MGKVEAVAVRGPSERLPLLGPAAPTAPLSQEEVVEQASAAPWLGLRKALLGLLMVLFTCLLSMAVLLLLTMPRPPPPLLWWQKASFYRLPPTAFRDSDGDGHGDLAGVRHQLDQLWEFPIQALVLGPILEHNVANLSRILPAHGSLEQLRVLVNTGLQKGIHILLELPDWGKEPDLTPDANQTDQQLKGAMEFWLEQGVCGFLVKREPTWSLERILNAWSALDSQRPTVHGKERVLMVLNESGTCNISARVPSSVILTCPLPLGEGLPMEGLAQWVQGPWGLLGRPWPSWTLPPELPIETDLGKALGILLLTLPGVPLLQGGKDSPLPLENNLPVKEGSNPGHPLASLYRSLLALHANTFALRGIAFVPLTFSNQTMDTFAFLRPSSCSSVLVILNLGSGHTHLHLDRLSIPSPARVIFSTHPEPQRETAVEVVELAPYQAVLFRVPQGHRQ